MIEYKWSVSGVYRDELESVLDVLSKERFRISDRDRIILLYNDNPESYRKINRALGYRLLGEPEIVFNWKYKFVASVLTGDPEHLAQETKGLLLKEENLIFYKTDPRSVLKDYDNAYGIDYYTVLNLSNRKNSQMVLDIIGETNYKKLFLVTERRIKILKEVKIPGTDIILEINDRIIF